MVMEISLDMEEFVEFMGLLGLCDYLPGEAVLLYSCVSLKSYSSSWNLYIYIQGCMYTVEPRLKDTPQKRTPMI